MDFTSDERIYLNSHPYKIEQVWEAAKNKRVTRLPIKVFKNSLTAKYWDDINGKDISPYEVLINPKRAPYHADAIIKADLTYPLIVSESNLDVLDGLHRLCKSIILNLKTVKVQKVSVNDLEKKIGKKTGKKSGKKSSKH
jgi:hypothetical protein